MQQIKTYFLHLQQRWSSHSGSHPSSRRNLVRNLPIGRRTCLRLRIAYIKHWNGCILYAVSLFLHSTTRKRFRSVMVTPHCTSYFRLHSYQHSFIIPLACAECDDSLLFSGASSIPLCYVLFPANRLCQLFIHPFSPHLAIYFLVYLAMLLFPNSCIILFWEFSFLPFSVHAQTNVIYLTFLFLL